MYNLGTIFDFMPLCVALVSKFRTGAKYPKSKPNLLSIDD